MMKTTSRLLLKPSQLSPLPNSFLRYSTHPTPSTSTSTPTPTPTPLPSTSTTPPTKSFSPTKTNLPGSNLPGAAKYSPITVSIVTSLAKLFGYHSQTSTAIRTASDYYDRCSERGQVEAQFFYDECALPPSFQTWFSITTLHIWLLSVRFRSLPSPLGETYIQELINHFFIDVELRIRGPYAVTQGKLIKGYMTDMLEQYRGSVAAYDEGLVAGDPVLAAAIWRNVFGAGWGSVGGVKGKRAPKSGEVPKQGPNPLTELELSVDPVQQKIIKKGQTGKDVFDTDEPIVDPTRASSADHSLATDPDLEFAQSLEKLVVYVRKQLFRLERLSDENVLHNRPATGRGSMMGFNKI